MLGQEQAVLKAHVQRPSTLKWRRQEEGHTDSHMIILGEYPAIEVRRDVIADIHLCHVLIVGHPVIWDPDTLLQ